jgi:hypothetical protein
MASLQERTGTYRVIFRFHGKQYFVMIGKVSPEEAEAKAAQVDYLLMRIKQGLFELPPGVDIAEFVQHDGKPPAAATPASASHKALTLAVLQDRYLATRATGREKSTLYTDGIHFKHLTATLGEKIPLEGLGQADLQRHIERRAKLGISATTIRKEITMFRTSWHWAIHAGMHSGDYPNKGLVYPKTDELPPYQTRWCRSCKRGSPALSMIPASLQVMRPFNLPGLHARSWSETGRRHRKCGRAQIARPLPPEFGGRTSWLPYRLLGMEQASKNQARFWRLREREIN